MSAVRGARGDLTLTLCQRLASRLLGWRYALVTINQNPVEQAVLRVYRHRRLGDVVYLWTGIASSFRRTDSLKIAVEIDNFEHVMLDDRAALVQDKPGSNA